MRRRWSDRPSRRVRTLVTQLARSRLIRESGRMRADIHDGPEQTLQSEAGYSNARPHQPGRRNLLHRTAGPYSWVIDGPPAVETRLPLSPREQTSQLDQPRSKRCQLRTSGSRHVGPIYPAESIELQTVRAICDNDFGIGRIGDANTRRSLYSKLTSLAPGERIPWHRLIRELLNEDDYETTEYVIRDAEAAVGVDAPIARFKIRLIVARAKHTKGISRPDRLAMLRHAYEQASRNAEFDRFDKYSFSVLCDVAVEIANMGGGKSL